MGGELALKVKPFGKDGVRLLFTGGGDGCLLEVHTAGDAEDQSASAWTVHTEASEEEGTVVVKGGGVASVASVREAAWRLRRGDACSDTVRFAVPAASAPSADSLSPVLELDDAELAFNVLQWFGTIVVDCRPDDVSPQLRESLRLHDAAAVAALPPKDDAIAIGASAEVLEALARRVRRAVYVLSEEALRDLCARYPALACADATDPAAARRPVLPNLVDGALLVGHQGHALCIADWESHVPLGCVLNLAAEHVDPQPARDAATAAATRRGDGGTSGGAWNVIEVRCPSDGMPLTDKPGDGARLIEALPAALDAIADGIASGRLAFLHCQQGRSRAGSIATAHLLATHPEWSLLDAVRFLAARRPETEIAEDYAVALEQWAISTLGRPPSLDMLRKELPRQLRAPPRIRSGGEDSRDCAGGAFALAAPTPVETGPGGKENAGMPIPLDSPLGRGSFGAAAIRRASASPNRTATPGS